MKHNAQHTVPVLIASLLLGFMLLMNQSAVAISRLLLDEALSIGCVFNDLTVDTEPSSSHQTSGFSTKTVTALVVTLMLCMWWLRKRKEIKKTLASLVIAGFIITGCAADSGSDDGSDGVQGPVTIQHIPSGVWSPIIPITGRSKQWMLTASPQKAESGDLRRVKLVVKYIVCCLAGQMTAAEKGVLVFNRVLNGQNGIELM